MGEEDHKSSRKLSRAETITLVIAALTLLATAGAAVPGFVALRARAAAILYETSSAQIAFPSAESRDTVRALLRLNKLPDASTKLTLSNRGDQPASEVVIALRVPGVVVGTRLNPSAADRPAWVSITEDSISDPSRRRYSLHSLATGPSLTIEVSFRSEPGDSVHWDVFADGHPARQVIALGNQPENVNQISFARPLRILGIGLLLALFAFLTAKSMETPAFRDALIIVLRTTIPFFPWHRSTLRTTRSKWATFADKIVLELAKSPSVRLLSHFEGHLQETDPCRFWDTRLLVGTTRVGLDIHTAAQSFDGLTGNLPAQEYYCSRLVTMAQSEEMTLVIVLDHDPSALPNTCEVPALLAAVASTNPAFKYRILGGSAAEVAAAIALI